jgi:hypothetical protein
MPIETDEHLYNRASLLLTTISGILAFENGTDRAFCAVRVISITMSFYKPSLDVLTNSILIRWEISHV